MVINAKGKNYKELNEAIRSAGEDISVENVMGQRFIAAGMSEPDVDIYGVPGNALGAYLNGATVNVHGNAQDAVGDTMNCGNILIDGRVGDAVGYAMRGGEILIHGDAGYRAGIHMKAYEDKIPHIVIGGRAGSFLGEYQAGGIIIVLNIEELDNPVGNFPCTGMHGGIMFIRGDCGNIKFPHGVTCSAATEGQIKSIRDILVRFCNAFGEDLDTLLEVPFTVVTPDSKNPYKQMYVAN